MEKGNIVFQVKKDGLYFNKKFDIYIDDEFVGQTDFKKNLKGKLTKGEHKIKYKLNLKETRELDINVGDEEVIVECLYNGTLNNFYVTNSLQNKDNNKLIPKLIAFMIAIVFVFIYAAISNDNTSTNSNIAVSDTDNITDTYIEPSTVSFTGMSFKTTWSYLKNEIDDYYKDKRQGINISDWKKDKPYGKGITEYRIIFYAYNAPTLQESAMGMYASQYQNVAFAFIVDDSTDKIIGITCSFLNTSNDLDELSNFSYILSKIDNTLAANFVDFLKKIADSGNQNKSRTNLDAWSSYKDNVFFYVLGNTTSTSLMILPATDEEVSYIKQNGQWRGLENLSN